MISRHIAIFAFLAAPAVAAPLDSDSNYGAEGRVSFGGMLSAAAPMLLQADAKLVVFGSRTFDDQVIARTVMTARRFNADGSVDRSFGNGGESQFAVRGGDIATSAIEQPDGKIVVGVAARVPCRFDVFSNTCSDITGKYPIFVGALVRLGPDGVLDKTFGGSGAVELTTLQSAAAIALQSDGRVLAVGNRPVLNATVPPGWTLLRVNGDGTLDATFGAGQPVGSSVCPGNARALLQRPDATLVVGSDWDGPCLERFLSDGRRDAAFIKGSHASGSGRRLGLHRLLNLENGQVLAISFAQLVTSIPAMNRYYEEATGLLVVRYLANGLPDLSYGLAGPRYLQIADMINDNGGYAPNSSVFTLVASVPTRDGGFVAAGYDIPYATSGLGYKYRSTLVKVDAHGFLDPAFGSGGIARTGAGSERVVGFARDLHDEWLLLRQFTDPAPQSFNSITRYIGEGSTSVLVTEFYNTALKHYFITADTSEAAAIDRGNAGPGWQRTGESFRAWQPSFAASMLDVPQATKPLCRFYGTPGVGPNSHFYTLNSTECDNVRRDRGWTFESAAFFAFSPLPVAYPGNRCPQSLTPVYRLYNNGFARGDSNHRYTANVTAYRQMLAQGWSDEGVAFCATAQ